jgi:hypothetical protein
VLDVASPKSTHPVPGFAALWQVGPLEVGAGLKYYGFLGVGGSLMAGARFF